MLGTYALSSGYYDAYYQRAQKLRKMIRQQFEELFKQYDVVIGPVSPILPFVKGEKMNDPLAMYLGDVYTVDVNLAELPAISLPCGFSKEGLPVGMQLIGKHFGERTLLQTAYQLEKSLNLDIRNAVGKEANK